MIVYIEILCTYDCGGLTAVCPPEYVQGPSRWPKVRVTLIDIDVSKFYIDSGHAPTISPLYQ